MSSSSLYSRYVPPKKPKTPIAVPPSPEPQASTVFVTPPSTLYARYIPPRDNARAIPHWTSPAPKDEEPKPKKRRKVERPKKDKTKGKSGPVDGLVHVDIAAEADGAEMGAKIKAEAEELPDTSGESDSDAQDAKAQAILAKYRHSVQIQTAINSKKAKEKVRTPTPEPELHGLEPLPQPVQAPTEAYNPTFDSLPSWIGEPRVITPNDTVKFENLGLSKRLNHNLARKDYTEALPVQCAVLPLMLSGPDRYYGDICVSAPTGSGKTMAYVLPLIEGLQNRLVRRLSGLIIVPTRELVVQAREVAKTCAAGTGVKFGTAVGNVALATEQAALIHKGQRYDPQGAKTMNDKAAERIRLGYDEDDSLLEDLVRLLPGHVPEYTSEVDILICTPGRLVDHIRSTPGFTLEHVEWLVIDEVDQLLDQNFQDFVNVLHPAMFPTKTYSEMTAREKVLTSFKGRFEHRFVQKVILSATMTRNLTQLASLKLNRPTLIALQSEQRTDGTENAEGSGGFELPQSLDETAIPVADGSDKPIYLVQLLHDEFSIFESSFSGSDSDSDSSSDDSDTSSDETSHSSDSDPDSGSGSGSGSDSGSGDEAVSERHKSSGTESATALTPLKPVARDSVLIFTSSNDNASRLKHLLLNFFPQHGSLVATLTKSSATSTGRKVLNAFRAGKVKVLIASDRASRGLDVPDLANVINYDMPSSIRSYIHRVGRTARAGKTGKAWTLYTDSEARWFWKSIAQGVEIQRHGRVVKRMRIDNKKLEDKRTRYQKALVDLQSAVQGTG